MAQEIEDSKLIDTWASSGLSVKPDISKIIEGWQLGEQPPHEYMNWLQNTFGSKLNHILKNGVASWNNTTQYLAGSSVQYNGNVWLCKATNTNSAPTDANANWKRIITVESLTTVLSGYVDTSSTQTIAGVKTFSSNPISSATQSTAVNALTRKDYVDGLNSTNVKLTGDQTIAGVKTFSSNPISSATQSTAVNALTRKDYVDGLNSTNVKLTGDQTIAGVKTFSSNPIVPTPTNGDNSTKVATTAFVKAKSEADSIGVNQTWQDVTASRSLGVTYINTTGKPIEISVRFSLKISSGVTFNIDGLSQGTSSAGVVLDNTLTYIIPDGSTYKATITVGTGSVASWLELR